MALQIIKRRNALGDAITGMTEGFIQGKKIRKEEQDSSLSNAYKIAQIQELKRKVEGMNAPAPAGYVRDSYTGDLKEDLSQRTLPTDQNLIPKEYDKYGRPKGYYDPGAELEREINKKDLMEQAKILPKLDQAVQASKQLQNLYGTAVTPKSVNPGDIMEGLRVRAGGLGQNLSAMAGANPNLQQYLNQRKAFSGLLAKGGFGEAGMLTNQDIERIASILPTASSTKQEADLAWNEINNILGSARKRFEEKKSGLVGGLPKNNDPLGVFS